MRFQHKMFNVFKGLPILHNILYARYMEQNVNNVALHKRTKREQNVNGTKGEQIGNFAYASHSHIGIVLQRSISAALHNPISFAALQQSCERLSVSIHQIQRGC